MTPKLAKPLGDRLLIKVNETQNTTTASGIIIPDSITAEDIKTGTVVSVGNGLFTQTGDVIPMTVKVGDEIVFPPFVGTDIKLDGEKYLVLRESEAFLVISN
jgi:chaperonin GroES